MEEAMIKVYHNPKCRKSREGLKYLQDKGVDFKVVNYIKDGITEKELSEIVLKLNVKPADIVRKQEDIYRKELKGRKFTDSEWIKILVENPRLLQRPIVIARHKAVIAQPPEKADELL
jgi:arsenate reductase (glutaredoxin)